MIKTTEIQVEDNIVKIHTLVCKHTGKKLINIMIDKENDLLESPVFTKIRAVSENHYYDSGWHLIPGLIKMESYDEGSALFEQGCRYSTLITDILDNGKEDDAECFTVMIELTTK